MEMVRLTTCTDAFEARVLAARLGSEGIVWSLRGGHDGPFAIGVVEVLVDADDYADARQLLESDVGWEGELGGPGALPERETTGREVLVLLAVLVCAVAFAIARMGARV
jgi:hypothetical protein